MDEPKPDVPKNENATNGIASTPDQSAAGGGNQTAKETPDAIKAELSKMAANEKGQDQSAGDPSSAPSAQKQSKMSKKMLFIGLAIFLVAAGLGYYLYHKSNSKKPAAAQTTSTSTPPQSKSPPAPPAAAPQPVSNDEQTAAEDTERQTDINSLDSHLEAFNADQGYYPTLTNMNTASWVSANLKGLDPVALQDPRGTSQTLVSAPQAKAYAYQPTNDSGKACDDSTTMCTKFALTAVLSTGQQYQKTSH